MVRSLIPGLLIMCLPKIALSEVLVVEADGSGPYPTLHAAYLASSPGDTIELGDGTFRGEGNRDLVIAGRRTIRSRTEPPAPASSTANGRDGASRSPTLRSGSRSSPA